MQCRCGAGSAPELVSRLPRFSYVSWSKFPWLRWEAGAGREGWPFAPPSAVCRMGHARRLWPGSCCGEPAAEERRVGPASGVGGERPNAGLPGRELPSYRGSRRCGPSVRTEQAGGIGALADGGSGIVRRGGRWSPGRAAPAPCGHWPRHGGRQTSLTASWHVRIGSLLCGCSVHAESALGEQDGEHGSRREGRGAWGPLPAAAVQARGTSLSRRLFQVRVLIRPFLALAGLRSGALGLRACITGAFLGPVRCGLPSRDPRRSWWSGTWSSPSFSWGVRKRLQGVAGLSLWVAPPPWGLPLSGASAGRGAPPSTRGGCACI